MAFKLFNLSKTCSRLGFNITISIKDKNPENPQINCKFQFLKTAIRNKFLIFMVIFQDKKLLNI